jgi:N-acetylneuraminate synthase
VKINELNIGLEHPPVIIAEMSGNHNQSLERALKIVDSAAKTGAQILKLQTYTADTITLNVNAGEFFISDQDSLWKNRSLYSLYSEAYTPWEWQKQIIEYATKKGLICFSSVFDDTSVDFLEDVGVPAYKIASQECIHLPLIEKVASTNKPIIMSTGMASLAEVDEAVNLIKKIGSSEIVLLKCTSTYPANPTNSNVLTIPYLRTLFGCEVGLSDHTLGVGAAVAAVAHGATVIEKHFTLSRADGGVDSAFSLEPQEMEQLVNETLRGWQSLGHVQFGPTEAEINSLSGRRSIYIAKDVNAGDLLTKENIRVVRPNLGMAPKYFDVVLGKRFKSDLKVGTPLSWDSLQ